MKENIRINKKWLVILFFTIFFIYGCLTFRDYGLSGDENLQRRHALVTYKYLVPSVANIVTDTVNFPEIPEISEYGSFYGVAIQLPPVIIEHIFGFKLSYQALYQMRHFYNFMMFFVAAILFYMLCKKVTGKEDYGLLGTVMLIVSPRILADSFYNVKDLMGLSLFVINLYVAYCTLYKPKLINLIVLAVTSALCINVRIVGGVIIAVCLFLILVEGLYKKDYSVIWKCIITGILTFVSYIFFTPMAWENLSNILMKTVSTFSNFTKWGNNNLYFGNMIKASQLPWHYLFVWIWITTPIAYTTFAVFGFIMEYFVMYENWKKKKADKLLEEVFFCLVLMIPFLYVVVVRPVLYCGWRHFYFIYPVIIIFSLKGFMKLLQIVQKKVWISCLIKVVLAVDIGSTLLWLGLNHPYGYVYFNPIVRPIVSENFEKDYWGTSGYDALCKILEMDERSNIKVWAINTSGKEFLLPEQANRITKVRDKMEADYVIEFYSAEPESYAFNKHPLFDEIYSERIDGFRMYTIFKRAYDFQERQYLLQDSIGRQEESVSRLAWQTEKDGLCGMAEIPFEIDKLTINFGDATLAKNTDVCFLQEDGSWLNAEEAANTLLIGSQIWVTGNQNVKGIRLNLTYADWEQIELNFYRERGKSETYASVLEATMGHTLSHNSFLAMDNDFTTQWNTEGQMEEEIFDITLKESMQIGGLRLDPGDKAEDLALQPRVFITNDGEIWEEVKEYETKDNISFTFSERECKMIRVITTEKRAENWNIAEVEIYRVIK